MKDFYKEYKVGQKIKINHIDDPYTNFDGKIGEIKYIDDIGQLHGSWGSVALIPEIDDIQIYEGWKNQLRKLHLNEDLNDYDWLCSDFYDNHCKIFNKYSAFYAEYDIHFIDEDFNFDNLTITTLRDWNDRNIIPRMSLNHFNKILMDNYYEEVQDGYIHAVYDDQIADYWIDTNDFEY